MKTLYKTILLLLLNVSLLVFNSFGQGENNIWYFGYNAGLDFNSGVPVPLTNGQLSQWEGVATISNSQGNLLFYTNGVTVWNRNHQGMPNGSGLKGSGTSTQSATIVPMPGSSTEYYIFTCPGYGFAADTFAYSIVDMTLDGGYGDITLKNVPLHPHSSEKCIAIYKNSSSDIWVIGHSADTVFYSYLVTSSGINPPVLSFSTPVPGGVGYYTGYMKASPAGNQIASATYSTGINNRLDLFDFDCATGNISNEMIIPTNEHLYGLEFSPDGTKLYVTPWTAIPTPVYQYDITLGTPLAIAASRVTVGYSNHNNVGAAQIGPDQKIYIVIDSHDSLSVINNPNMQGAACNFVDDAVYLGGNSSGIGLPALIRGSTCNTTDINENTTVINNIYISPNPSSGIFKITFPSSSNKKTHYTLEVISTLGQTVFSSDLRLPTSDFQTQIDVSFLPKGIYVLRINDGTSAASSKFVIE